MPTVLIVDDALFMRKMIRRILEHAQFEVVGEAYNGLEAVEMYEKFLPDVVTMDVTMPGMSGIEAVQAIVKKYADAKIVMVTAIGKPKLVVEAIESGAKDFITKPFNPELMVEILKNVTDWDEMDE
ncbi:response regulator [Psychrobacillus sp.]|uniref:response regulator n=1 Tax=Psychrobacillus sp. TaxID=1871623 RepID=UPI0028BE118A|nr:response regulator [Psychrobacillus sp.]